MRLKLLNTIIYKLCQPCLKPLSSGKLRVPQHIDTSLKNYEEAWARKRLEIYVVFKSINGT